MDMVLVLVIIMAIGIALGYVIFGHNKVSEEKKIFFAVINEMHAHTPVERIEDKLQKKYNINKHEAGIIVAAIIDGDSTYAMDYTKELLKKYEKAN
jgi:hypothetical protein